ncbi:hypothetical protein HYT24_03120 [Candidatus Pacearchaeota archaeon]|nr:hypothetical protein [Candidatus Pacearchaeota archaeon]
MQKEIEYGLKGIFFFVVTSLIITSIIYFNKFLIDYSGVLTFLSVIVILIIFWVEYQLKTKEKEKVQINLLKSIKLESKIIGSSEKYKIGSQGPMDSHLIFYRKNLESNPWKIPPHAIISFNVDSYMSNLSPSFKKIPTNPLMESMLLANDKIEIINNLSDTILDLYFFNPNLSKKDEKAMIQKQTEARSIIMSTLNDLEVIILDIKNYLSKFGIKD